MIRPFHGATVFAVEDDSMQVTARTPEPFVAEIDGLEPDTTHTVQVDVGGTRRHVTARTLAPPPGEPLFRFATVSDLHLGSDHFGLFGTMREPGDVEAHTARCTRAALAEIVDWGAEMIIVKGDMVHHSNPHSWAVAADLFGALPVPVHMICGNHDVSLFSTTDAFAEAEFHGLRLHREVASIDVPGLRLVLMDSSMRDIDIGRWNHLREPVADELAAADGPAMLVVHHQPQRYSVPTYLPRGIPRMSVTPFVEALLDANPQLFATSGHTHRNRRYSVHGVPWTEVGSPKDFPGSWAGYVVHEGGIRQVVRRVEDRSARRWLDYSARAAAGAWGWWAPGRLEDRCFTHVWPGHGEAAARR